MCLENDFISEINMPIVSFNDHYNDNDWNISVFVSVLFDVVVKKHSANINTK